MELPTWTSGISPINERLQEAEPSLEGKLLGLTQVHQPNILITEDCKLRGSYWPQRSIFEVLHAEIKYLLVRRLNTMKCHMLKQESDEVLPVLVNETITYVHTDICPPFTRHESWDEYKFNLFESKYEKNRPHTLIKIGKILGNATYPKQTKFVIRLLSDAVTLYTNLTLQN